MFKQDYKDSERSRSFTIKELIKDGFASSWQEPPEGYFLEHDGFLTVDGNEDAVEYKNDRMTPKTGNVAIEFFNLRTNKRSGILTTVAKWYVYTLPHYPVKDKTTIGVIDTQILKQAFKNKTFYTRKKVPMGDKHGDTKAACGFLVPVQNYLQKCYKVITVDGVY